MARRGKTVIGGGAGQQAERSSRAAERGAAGVRQARGQLLSQGERQADRATQLGSQIGGALERHESRGQQQSQFEEGQTLRRDIATGQQAGQREALDLQAADKGLERTGEPGQNPMLDERQAKLQAEMEKGGANLGKQVDQPLEMPGGGRGAFQPGEARVEREAKKAATEEAKSQAYSQQVATSARRAAQQGDVEAYKKEAASLAAPLKRKAKAFDKFMNGEEPDWGNLAAMTQDNPDPALRAAIEDKGATPESRQRVKQFMQAEMDRDAIRYISELGDIPSDDEGVAMVDMTSPMMLKFQETTGMVTQALKLAPPSATAGIKSVRQKNRYVRKLAAYTMMKGTQMPGQGPSAQGSMPPSMGGEQPGAPAAAQEQPAGAPEGAGFGYSSNTPVLRGPEESSLPTDETGAVEGKQYGERQGLDEQGNPVTKPIRQDESPEAQEARRRGRAQRR